MTETTSPAQKRPLVTRTGIVTSIIAFALPVLAYRLILSAMTEPFEGGMGLLVGNALYAAAPFALLDSAMRPRRRVRLALWAGLALTVLVWAAFAQTGRAAQIDAAAGNAHLGLYMLTMIWPAVLIVLMGVAAKFGETDHVA